MTDTAATLPSVADPAADPAVDPVVDSTVGPVYPLTDPAAPPVSDPVTGRSFELSPDLLWAAGLDGLFRHLNPAWETLLGVPLAELVARPFLEFVHPSDRPDTLAAMRRLAGERAAPFENRYRRGDGLYTRLLWSAAPAPDGLVYAPARDVTAAREAEAQEAAQKEAKYQGIAPGQS